MGLGVSLVSHLCHRRGRSCAGHPVSSLWGDGTWTRCVRRRPVSDVCAGETARRGVQLGGRPAWAGNTTVCFILIMPSELIRCDSEVVKLP